MDSPQEDKWIDDLEAALRTVVIVDLTDIRGQDLDTEAGRIQHALECVWKGREPKLWTKRWMAQDEAVRQIICGTASHTLDQVVTSAWNLLNDDGIHHLDAKSFAEISTVLGSYRSGVQEKGKKRSGGPEANVKRSKVSFL